MTTTMKPNGVRQVYRNGLRGDHALRYYVCSKTGSHMVVDEPANDEPTLHRHDTIEAARATWTRLRDRLTGRGYTLLRTQARLS